MDANEYALKVTPAAKSLGVLLNKAEWLGKGNHRRQKKNGGGGSEPEIEPAAAEPRRKSLFFLQPPKSPAPAIDVQPRSTPRDHHHAGRPPLPHPRPRKELSYDVLNVNLLASRGDDFHVDTLDLYSARQRTAFVKQAAIERA